MASSSLPMTVAGTPTMCIDTFESLQGFMTELAHKITSGSTTTLYLDLEGNNLSRHGNIFLLALLLSRYRTPDCIYLIDVHTLGASTFTTNSIGHDRPMNLHFVLESESIRKVLFDGRNDSDALFAHFGIRLKCVMDLQLMENASRKGNARGKEKVHSLATCIAKDSGLSQEDITSWEISKTRGRSLFASEPGGNPEVFDERPLKEELKVYCMQDVLYLPILYGIYRDRFLYTTYEMQWCRILREETDKRVEESTKSAYEPHGREKALAPIWRKLQRDMNNDPHDYVWEDWGFFEDDYMADDMTAADCPGYEDDMIKNGEW